MTNNVTISANNGVNNNADNDALGMRLGGFSQEDINAASSGFKKGATKRLLELYKAIGTSGYEGILARIAIVDLVWDRLEEMREYLKPKHEFVVWEKYAGNKIFSNQENWSVIPREQFNKMTVTWWRPIFDLKEGVRVDEDTYLLWHTFAKFQDVLEIYRPGTLKDARAIITAVRAGDELALVESYCIIDSPEIVAEVKAAAPEGTYGSRHGLPKTGRPQIDPQDKALLQFTKAGTNCLEVGFDLKDLVNHLKVLAKK